MADSPPFTTHLFTVEAAPADEMDPDAPGHVFVSRCICGWDGAWLPYPAAMRAVGQHLKDAGLITETAEDAITAAERKRLASVPVDRWGHTIAGYTGPEHHPEDRWDRGYQCAMREVAALLSGDGGGDA